MTFVEKTTDPTKLRRWRGNIEADYIYTSGIAGEKFFKELTRSGKLMATHCPRCDLTYLPPRMYCERCLVEAKEWREVPPVGQVEAFTVSRQDEEGSELLTPEVWALIRFPDIHGGFVHRLSVPPEKVKAGMKVRPRLKSQPDRTGEITDIMFFEPV